MTPNRRPVRNYDDDVIGYMVTGDGPMRIEAISEEAAAYLRNTAFRFFPIVVVEVGT